MPVLLALAGAATACGASGAADGGAQPPSSTATSPRGPASLPSSAQAPVPVESNPPGDIPDNLAYVPYSAPAGRFTFTPPEGWAQVTAMDGVLFAQKLDAVRVTTGTRTTAPAVADAKAHDVPALAAAQPAFELRSVAPVMQRAGAGVLIVYRRNSAPDPVTGRRYRDEVERYDLVLAGREVVMELSGPVGADNVDAYRIMITSLRQS